MHISVETQNVDLSPEWRRKIEGKLDEWSDQRDPVISARATVSFRSGEIPPAAVSLIINMRGKSIVVNKRGETVDATLKSVLDTAKREVREFYRLRSDYRARSAQVPEMEVAEAAPEPVEDAEIE